MTLPSIDQLPDESRVWIFGTDRQPDPRQAAHLIEETRRFLESWTAHRTELRATFDWLHHRFLLVAVDESRAGASGCSIDALTRRLAELEEETGLGLLDASPVWYRASEDGQIRVADRHRFGELAREGGVGGDTIVFDLTVDRLGPVREGRWEGPARERWQAALLPHEGDPPGEGARRGEEAPRKGGGGRPDPARGG